MSSQSTAKPIKVSLIPRPPPSFLPLAVHGKAGRAFSCEYDVIEKIMAKNEKAKFHTLLN